ncbi:MAG: hypothetical protein ACRDRA_10195, partial [Pseudonocardiaceae bacterium]
QRCRRGAVWLHARLRQRLLPLSGLDLFTPSPLSAGLCITSAGQRAGVGLVAWVIAECMPSATW